MLRCTRERCRVTKLPDDYATPALAISQESGTEDVPELPDADPDDDDIRTRAVFIDPVDQDPGKLREIRNALEQDSQITTIRLYYVHGSPESEGWDPADQAAGVRLRWERVSRFGDVNVRSGIATRMILDVVDLLENSTTAVGSVCLWTSDPNLAYLAQWIQHRHEIPVFGVSTTDVHEALQNACNFFRTFKDDNQPDDAAGEDDTRWVGDVKSAVNEISSQRGSKWVPYTALGMVLRRNGVDYASKFGTLTTYLERGLGEHFKQHVETGRRSGAPPVFYLALAESDPPDPPTAQDLRGRMLPRLPDQSRMAARDRSARRDWDDRDDPRDRRRGNRGERDWDDHDDPDDRRRGNRGERDWDDRDRRRGGRGERDWDDRDRRRGGRGERDWDDRDRRRGGRGERDWDDPRDRRRGGRDDYHEDRHRE